MFFQSEVVSYGPRMAPIMNTTKLIINIKCFNGWVLSFFMKIDRRICMVFVNRAERFFGSSLGVKVCELVEEAVANFVSSFKVTPGNLESTADATKKSVVDVVVKKVLRLTNMQRRKNPGVYRCVNMAVEW